MAGIIDVLQFAADGVTQQQQSIANNLANANTPDYVDNETSFATSLDNALSSAGDQTATISTQPSTAAAGTNGNNVSLNTELLEAEKATLQFQTVSESLNAQFRLVAGSAGGSFT